MTTLKIILAVIGAAVCFGYAFYLMHQRRKPDGCWYKPTGFLRDDNYKSRRKAK